MKFTVEAHLPLGLSKMMNLDNAPEAT